MDNYNFDIQEELKKLPASPGVYIMHDEKDNIIYVGKAISLKNRVLSLIHIFRAGTAEWIPERADFRYRRRFRRLL